MRIINLWVNGLPFLEHNVMFYVLLLFVWSLYFFPQIMAYTNFERTIKRRILTEIFYSWNALKRIKPMFWSFSAVWIFIKNRKLKKLENEDDLDLFLSEPNFMRDGIVSPSFLSFSKVTHQKVCLSAHKVWT